MTIETPQERRERLQAVSRKNGQRVEKLITYEGETHNISDWAKKLGIKRTTLIMRLKVRSVADAFKK